jgi:predicted small lipoprotein YifL
MKRLNSLFVVLCVLSIALTACGGGAAADPAATVKAAMDAVVNKQFDKIVDFSCAAKKDQVAGQLNPAAQLANAGMDAATTQQLLDSMTITLTGGEFTKLSETGDTAQVQMKGSLAMKFDREKLKAVVVSLLKSQGMDATDDIVNQALDQVSGQLEKGQDIDNKVDLVKENGKWVICPAD